MDICKYQQRLKFSDFPLQSCCRSTLWIETLVLWIYFGGHSKTVFFSKENWSHSRTMRQQSRGKFQAISYVFFFLMLYSQRWCRVSSNKYFSSSFAIINNRRIRLCGLWELRPSLASESFYRVREVLQSSFSPWKWAFHLKSFGFLAVYCGSVLLTCHSLQKQVLKPKMLFS